MHRIVTMSLLPFAILLICRLTLLPFVMMLPFVMLLLWRVTLRPHVMFSRSLNLLPFVMMPTICYIAALACDFMLCRLLLNLLPFVMLWPPV